MTNEKMVLEFDDKEIVVIEAFAKGHGLSIEDAVRKILFDHINEQASQFFLPKVSKHRIKDEGGI